MSSTNNSKELKKLIIRKREDIKKKLDLLKYGERMRENLFTPITDHLKDIKTSLSNKQAVTFSSPLINSDYEADSTQGSFQRDFSMKKDINDYDDDKNIIFPNIKHSSVFTSTPKNQKSYTTTKNDNSSLKTDIINDILNEEKEEEYEKNEQFKAKNREASFSQYLDQYPPLIQTYIYGLNNENTKSEFDQKYGMKFDPLTEKFYIGNSQVYITHTGDLIVQNKTYRGTKGLFELIFKKYPKKKHYNETDLKNYREIVKKTNAHRRYYQENEQVDGNRLKKYKKIIAPLTRIKKGGNVLLKLQENSTYSYWDDPNELVERLKLLLASHVAGNTGVINEITSIIEELIEANIIR